MYVGDTGKVKLWLLDNPKVSGIFNVGTGRSQSFNDVRAPQAWHKRGTLEYIPFPDHCAAATRASPRPTSARAPPATRMSSDRRAGRAGVLDWLNRRAPLQG